MKTSEEASLSGLYVSECCDVGQVFAAGDTAWRCPNCHNLCNWELVQVTFSPRAREEGGVATL
jgi:hypothetical protein